VNDDEWTMTHPCLKRDSNPRSGGGIEKLLFSREERQCVRNIIFIIWNPINDLPIFVQLPVPDPTTDINILHTNRPIAYS
jgi:hypothetical protein